MEVFINGSIKMLEGMFFLGLLGSALVILLTAVDDIRVLLEQKER